MGARPGYIPIDNDKCILSFPSSKTLILLLSRTFFLLKMDPQVEDFFSEQTIEKLLKLKREHLISLMSHYGLVVDKSKRKAQIRDKLITHMVENDILSGDALEYISKEEKSEALMIKEMELEYQKELRLRELDYEERKRKREKKESMKKSWREKSESLKESSSLGS